MKLKLLLAILAISPLLLPCAAQKQHGKASFYSKRATGSRAASGRKIHHDSLTCAHRSYPFGTKLKVTNLKNNKSVIVEVIDRGPFGRGRIIDLSWAAAKEIGMIAQGIASVKVEKMESPIPYRPEDTKLPQIDFEVAETEFSFGQKWGEMAKKKKENAKSNLAKNEEEHHKKKKEEEHTLHYMSQQKEEAHSNSPKKEHSEAKGKEKTISHKK